MTTILAAIGFNFAITAVAFVGAIAFGAGDLLAYAIATGASLWFWSVALSG